MGNSCCLIGDSQVPKMGKNVVLKGPSSTYRTERIIGQGVYGKVVRCKKLDTKEIVALKIVRKDFKNAGKMEISNMNLLRRLNSDTCNIIKMTDHFVYMQQHCLAFEMLDKDLFEYMKDRYFLPMRVPEIRLITQQMLVALAALKTIGVVHTDIKPDNIMLVNHRLNPFKVKLIDFGIAKQVSHLRTGSSIQPNSYRAFEVTLGLPLNEAVDMWGLGCTLAFFYTGGLLFPSDCEYENMRAYVELYGQPENYLLNTGLYAKIFFKLTQETPEVIWKLKTPNEYAATIGEQVRKPKASCSLIQSYDDLERMSPNWKDPDERKDIQAFISLLKQMMALDPNKRISPSEALRQDFITVKHLAGS